MQELRSMCQKSRQAVNTCVYSNYIKYIMFNTINANKEKQRMESK